MKHVITSWAMVLSSLFSFHFACAQDVKMGKMEYLKGTVGTYPVTMTIWSDGASTSGCYYYDRYERPINMFPDEEQKPNKLHFVGTDEFELQPTSDGYSGVCKTGDPVRTYQVQLKRVEPQMSFRVYLTNTSYHPVTQKNKGPEYKYSDALWWPAGSDDRSTFIAQAIKKEFKARFPGVDSAAVSAYLFSLAKEDLADYKKEIKGVSASDLIAGAIGYSRETMNQVHVHWFSHDLCVVSTYGFMYTGGAHGISGESFTNLDLKYKKEIGFKDLFSVTGAKMLPAMLEKAYRREKGLKPTQALSEGGLFEDHIAKASENILVNTKGVLFHYGEYEIAPYSEGMVEIFVPWSELMPALMPAFRQRLAEGL